MSQRILFGVLKPHGGGHTRSAVALADAMRSRGHYIDFLVTAPGEVAKTRLITDAGFRVVTIEDHYADLWRSTFPRTLRDLVRRNSYDVLHWFELTALRPAALVATAEGRAFIWTHPSGGPPPGYFGLNRIVVFTPEVAEDVRRRSPRTSVHILPARLNCDVLDREFVDGARRDIRGRFGIASGDLLIVRVARCADVYLRSVRLGIELAVRLTRTGRPARFLHAGFREEARCAREIRRLVDLANAGATRPIAYSLTDNLDAGTRYMAAADVCIASGRSALEALTLERPTLVAWGPRYLGIVDHENIAAIALTNFQGRNTETVTSDEEVVAAMDDAVSARVAEPARAAHVHAACATFVRERYSVESAADAYERLYADRTIRVEGFLTHFSNPRHLGAELFHRLPPGIRFSRPLNFLRRTALWPGLPTD